jgi:hypothetical protein
MVDAVGPGTPRPPNPVRQRAIVANGIAGIAALLWVSSLVLPVVVLEQGTVRGWVILVFGLLGRVGPWLAKLAVAGAIWSLFRGSEARGWLAFASLCAPTLLAVEGFSFAGNAELTYGYGLGALGFGLAIAVLWVATGLGTGCRAVASDDVEPPMQAGQTLRFIDSVSIVL